MKEHQHNFKKMQQLSRTIEYLDSRKNKGFSTKRTIANAPY